MARKLTWLLTRKEAAPKDAPIVKGATEVEAVYLAHVRDYWSESDYYSAAAIAEWMPKGYTLQRCGETTSGVLWFASGCYYDSDGDYNWAPSCYIIDGGEMPEVVVTKSHDGTEVRVREEWESAVAAFPEAFAEDTEATVIKHANGQLIEKSEKRPYRVIKSDQVMKYTLGVAYPIDKVDSHGDWTTAEELELAAWNFMAKALEVGTDHEDGTDGAAEPVESYIYRGPDWEVEMPDGETQIIKSGDWLVGAIWSDDGWARVEKGELTGWSIQGLAAIDDDAVAPE